MILRSAARMLSPRGGGARLTILIFHRVHDDIDPLFPGEPDKQRFDQILGWVRRWFTVLPLDSAVRQLREGSLPAAAAAITFDDGYADNERNAMPILQRHGMAATFFVASDFLDGGRMWNDSVVEAVRGSRHANLDLDAAGLGRHALDSMDERRRAIQAILQQIKYLEPVQRRAAVTAVVKAADAPLPDDLMMSTRQLRALQAGGMQIGAHTSTHPILARLDDNGARAEILEGKSRLESLLQARIGMFAYPNGKPGQDYLASHVAMVQALGFDAAVSTAAGVASREGDYFQLPRFTPWDRSAWRYGARLVANLRAGAGATV